MTFGWVRSAIRTELVLDLVVEFAGIWVVEGVVLYRIAGERLQNVLDGGTNRSLHDLDALGK